MGGEERGQEKVSHQKNLISHSDTHENSGREAWAVGNGCGCVFLFSCICVSVCVGKGFISSFFIILR